MKVCSHCNTIYPEYRECCPSCFSKEHTPLNLKGVATKPEVKEKQSALVVLGEIDLDGFRDDASKGR